MLFRSLGFAPQITIYVSICVSILALYARLLILKALVELKSIGFFKNVILRVFIVSFVAFILPFFVYNSFSSSYIRLITLIIMCLLSAFGSIYLIGLDKLEKLFIKDKIYQLNKQSCKEKL